MVTRAYFARRFLALKVLRGTLVAGALYDVGLALLLLWRPAVVAPLSGAGAGPSPSQAQMAALALALFAALAVAAARDVRRYSAVIAALFFNRAVTAIILAFGAATMRSAALWMAGWSALLAVTLIVAWRPLRG